jgi:hypothetical protein
MNPAFLVEALLRYSYPSWHEDGLVMLLSRAKSPNLFWSLPAILEGGNDERSAKA